MVALIGIHPILLVFPIIFGLSAGTMAFAPLLQDDHLGRRGQRPLMMHRSRPGRFALAVLTADGRR